MKVLLHPSPPINSKIHKNFSDLFQPCTLTVQLSFSCSSHYCLHIMSTSMSLEERLETLMQSYQTVTSLNEEMRSRNEYLRKQLEQSMNQKRRAFDSPSISNPEDPNERAKSPYSEVEGEEVEQPGQTPRREWRISYPILMILELNSRSSKASLIQMSS